MAKKSAFEGRFLLALRSGACTLCSRKVAEHEFTAFRSQKPSRRCGSLRLRSRDAGPTVVAGRASGPGGAPSRVPGREVRHLRMSERRLVRRSAGGWRAGGSGLTRVGGGRHPVGARAFALGGRPRPTRRCRGGPSPGDHAAATRVSRRGERGSSSEPSGSSPRRCALRSRGASRSGDGPSRARAEGRRHVDRAPGSVDTAEPRALASSLRGALPVERGSPAPRRPGPTVARGEAPRAITEAGTVHAARSRRPRPTGSTRGLRVPCSSRWLGRGAE